MFGLGLWPYVLRAPLERGEHSVRSVRGYTSPPMSSWVVMMGFSKRPLAGGGGICGPQFPAIYRNFTAILPQFFSDASIQKFHFSPEENTFLPSLSLGTLYVYVFSSVLHVIFVAGRFLFFVFPNCHPLLGTVLAAMVKGQ